MSVLLDPQVHRVAVLVYFGLALATLVLLLFVRAPYGRHDRPGWGPRVPSRLAWLVMEAPASLAFLGFYLLGENRADLVPLVLLGLWQVHYVQRAFVFPWLLRVRGKSVPLLVPVLAVLYNLFNAWANATWIAHLGEYTPAWLTDPRFVVGTCLFVAGYAVNRWADAVLRGLRAPGESDYKVPYGGLYRWVSSPNYAGEIVQWIGWALASWSWAGAAFAAYTVANLLPRALANHQWYQAHFEDYPEHRKALVPFLL